LFPSLRGDYLMRQAGGHRTCLPQAIADSRIWENIAYGKPAARGAMIVGTRIVKGVGDRDPGTGHATSATG